MQKDFSQNIKSNFKWYGLILLLLFVAYLPITSFYSAIKNDFFQAYFPVKFFFSKSIRAGEWPIWNPFLNYGFPSYGDMSASYWNPITWIFAIIGYNAYLFTIEHLIYLYLAGLGMFILMGRWIESNKVRFIVAATYLCSGFSSAHLQHFNWITAVGLLPFCVHYFLQFRGNSKPTTALKMMLVFSIYITAVHPGMIIGLILLLFLISTLLKQPIEKKNYEKNSFIAILIFFVLFLAGMIYGYSEVIFETNRANPVSDQNGINGSTFATNWISFILPLIVNDRSGIFSNELTLRNCYIGLTIFASIIVSIFSRSNKKNIYSFYITGLFFLILSSDFIHIIYEKIPIINFVRLNGEFRLFGLFSLIIGGGIQLNELIRSVDRKFIITLNILLLIIAFLILVTIIIDAISNKNSLAPVATIKSKTDLKLFLDHFNWKQGLLIQGVLQIFFLSGLILTYKRRQINLFITLIILDLIINTFIQLPFIAVGRSRLIEIQNLIDKSPLQPKTPSYINEADITKNYPSTEKYIGGWGFYSNQIALKENLYYPLMLSSNLQYFKNGTHDSLTAKPFIFSLNNNIGYKYVKNGYHFWNLKTNSRVTDTLVIKQNIFKGWHACIDGNETKVFKTNTSLIGIAIHPGNHEIKIEYKRDEIKYLLLLQWIFIAISIIYLIRIYLIKYILP